MAHQWELYSIIFIQWYKYALGGLTNAREGFLVFKQKLVQAGKTPPVFDDRYI